MAVRNVPLQHAGPSVREAMLTGPRTISAATRVEELREEAANPRVRMLLVADGDAFVGCVRSEVVLGHPDGSAEVGRLVDHGIPRVAPGDPVGRALELLEGEPSERLPVVEADGRLAGLICFNRGKGHFCVDG